jgi:colicin import membrane protein
VEKERLAEAEELNRRHAAADAEIKRLAIERAKALEAENRKLTEEQAKLEEERQREATATAAETASGEPGAMEPKRLVPLDPATARAAEERRRLMDLNTQSEADRLTQQRLAAEVKAREAAAKRAEAEAATLRTVALFYETLSSQGDRFDSDRYGYVWQPKRAAIDREWRP